VNSDLKINEEAARLRKYPTIDYERMIELEAYVDSIFLNAVAFEEKYGPRRDCEARWVAMYKEDCFAPNGDREAAKRRHLGGDS
jgi:hypothetical protein